MMNMIKDTNIALNDTIKVSAKNNPILVRAEAEKNIYL